MGNMSLEDILEMLGGVGSVTLRKSKNPRSASPGIAPFTGWTCEVSLPGYNNSGHTISIVSARGATGMEAADACHAAVEAFLDGDEGRTARERYETTHAFLRKRWEEATSDQRHSGHNPIRPPSDFAPPASLR